MIEPAVNSNLGLIIYSDKADQKPLVAYANFNSNNRQANFNANDPENDNDNARGRASVQGFC